MCYSDGLVSKKYIKNRLSSPKLVPLLVLSLMSSTVVIICIIVKSEGKISRNFFRGNTVHGSSSFVIQLNILLTPQSQAMTIPAHTHQFCLSHAESPYSIVISQSQS